MGLPGGCSRARREPSAAPQPGPVSTLGQASVSEDGRAPGAVEKLASRARVAHITHDGVWAAAGQLNRSVVLQMLDEAVRLVTGVESAEAAWSTLFASDDVVAIKVNQISPNVFSNPVVAMAIAERLVDTGLRPGNIIIWDRKREELARNGYHLDEDPSRVIVRGVDGEWEDQPVRQGSFCGRLAKIITRQCSAIVNVPVLKDHSGSGITLAMKNHYGSHDNPNAHHANRCDPYIADLNSIPAIKDKTRLIVCDATVACFRGGPHAADPRGRWQPNAILAATDPVAHDTYGAALIGRKRLEKGLSFREPQYLASAKARGLGTNDLSRISVLETKLA